MDAKLSCRGLLLQELEGRKARNPAYSLRAFSRDLRVSLTALSDVLNQKRHLSRRNLERLIEGLALSPEQAMRLRDEARVALSRAKRDEVEKIEQQDRVLVEEDSFRLTSEWYYPAIFALSRMRSARADAQWIAERLGLRPEVARQALERLVRMGLVKSLNGKLSLVAPHLSTSRDVPSVAIRRHHLGNLELAERSLLEDPLSRREFSSITFPVNPAKLRKAKDLLMKAKRQVAALLNDDDATDVYTLSFQLFPLTRGEGTANPLPDASGKKEI